MAQILRNWRIVAALFVAVLLVCLAYAFATPSSVRVAEASTESALLQQIATEDSDGDGLPDWEEALYGTDPHATDTKHLGMTDGEAVAKGLIVPPIEDATAQTTATLSTAASYGLTSPAAGSLTQSFAQNFLSLYLNAKQANGGTALTEDQTAAIAKQAFDQLAQSVSPSPDFLSAANQKTVSSDASSLKTYAQEAEAVIAQSRNPANEEKSELEYLTQELRSPDAKNLEHISEIAKKYRETASGLAVLSTPNVLAPHTLLLINAMARISQITDDLARVHSDPLAAMLALAQYPETVYAMGQAFIDVHNTYTTSGVSFSPGEPGGAFVNVMQTVAKQQAATTTP